MSGCEGTEYSAGAEPVGAAREPGVPLRTLFQIAKDCGSTIVAGIDAHDPDCFFQPETFAPYQAFVAECGLTVTDSITLRPVRR